MEYKMSFWNYAPFGATDIDSAVKEWKKAGMNYPMSFYFNHEKDNVSDMLRLLDECDKLGMKVIVDDKRVDHRRYYDFGEERYRKEVKQASEDFGSHPAFFGFQVADEPGKNWMDGAEHTVKAFNIVNEYCPNKTHFVNLLPYWGNDDDEFVKCFDIEKVEDYFDMVAEFIKKTGVKMVCYDYYGQCSYFDREKYIDIYFANLKMFGGVAEKTGVELWMCPLSCAHMSTKVPDEDEFRWQIATAAAHGVVGFVWFFMYERGYDTTFRNSPFDLYYEKTATYEHLARQCRIFTDHHAERLKDYKFLWAKHVNKTYGGVEKFDGDEDFAGVKSIINETTLIVSKFINDKKEIIIALTNASQHEPAFVEATLRGKTGSGTTRFWIAPGQMKLISDKFWL